MKKGFGLVLLLLFVFSVVYPGYANWGGGVDGNIGTGNFNAIGTGQVEMVKETLNIELYQSRAVVHVEYLLHNTGNAVNVRAGFPSFASATATDHNFEPDEDLESEQNSEEQDPEQDPDQDNGSETDANSDHNQEPNQEQDIMSRLEIMDYKIVVNNRQVPFYVRNGGIVKWFQTPDSDMGEPTDPVIYWLISDVKFEKNETKTVSISYEVLYQRSFGGISGDTNYGAQYLFYFLSTGSTWKGPIQSGTVNIKPVAVNPEQLTISPDKRFVRKDNIITWSFKNLKPSLKDNITISLNNGYSVKTLYRENGTTTSYLVDTDGKYYFDFNEFHAKASSTLKGKFSYEAANVIDGDYTTAWVEGVNGDGIGESLTLTLNKPTKVSKIGIVPGYTKSRIIFFANNRIAELKIVVNDVHTVTRNLYDDFVTQYLDLGNYNKDVKTIKLIITKVYKGTKYNDTCISEIVLRKQLLKAPEGHGAR